MKPFDKGGNMNRVFSHLLIPALALSMLTACMSLEQARERHRLSDARQIAATRLQMIDEHPENQVPSLADIIERHELVTAERVAPFEITDAWHNPAADKQIVLQQIHLVHKRRVVAQGNGIAMVINR